MHCQMQRGLKVFNTPRQHGRSEDSSIENTIILEVKVKKKQRKCGGGALIYIGLR